MPKTSSASMVVLMTALLASCSTAPTTPTARDELSHKAMAEREEWKRLDPDIEDLARKSEGYAFFPEITKGGLVVGGGYGRGVVFQHNQPIGFADVTQGSVGLQAGGQTYSELIVFENKAAFDRFKNNQLEFGANASAIIARTGAARNARFVDGVAIFVRPVVGAMAEASVGGQRVTYVAK